MRVHARLSTRCRPSRSARLTAENLGCGAQKISSTSSRDETGPGQCGKPQIFAQTGSTVARTGEGDRRERDVRRRSSASPGGNSQGSRRQMSRAWWPLPLHWRIAAGKGFERQGLSRRRIKTASQKLKLRDLHCPFSLAFNSRGYSNRFIVTNLGHQLCLRAVGGLIPGSGEILSASCTTKLVGVFLDQFTVPYPVFSPRIGLMQTILALNYSHPHVTASTVFMHNVYIRNRNLADTPCLSSSRSRLGF